MKLMKTCDDQTLKRSNDQFFCLSPLTRRQIPSGLSFFNSGGNNESGKFWQQTGLVNRLIAPVPTEVVLLSVVAGNGPPCTIEWQTSTPVG